MNNSRMEWVDAMRGFSMMIVVFGHVLLYMGIGLYDSFLSTVLLTFRMPLFFFVSGFFSFRSVTWWNRERVTDIMKRKFQAQIICTLVFLFVFQYSTTGEMGYLGDGFGGYWFTIVLFQMYVIFLAISLISRITRKNLILPVMILLSLAGIGLLAIYSRDAWIWDFLCWENLCKYFQFFTLGIICAKYKDNAFKYLANNKVVSIATIGWAVCMIIWYNVGIKNTYPIVYSFIHDIVVRYFALITIVALFFGYQEKLATSTRWCEILRFIGRRTLDIYMIHYFFLPDLSGLTDYFQAGNTILLQIIVASALTIAIVVMCLTISTLLRRSKFLESWLFGVKPRLQTA